MTVDFFSYLDLRSDRSQHDLKRPNRKIKVHARSILTGTRMSQVYFHWVNVYFNLFEFVSAMKFYGVVAAVARWPATIPNISQKRNPFIVLSQ